MTSTSARMRIEKTDTAIRILVRVFGFALCSRLVCHGAARELQLSLYLGNCCSCLRVAWHRGMFYISASRSSSVATVIGCNANPRQACERTICSRDLKLRRLVWGIYRRRKPKRPIVRGESGLPYPDEFPPAEYCLHSLSLGLSSGKPLSRFFYRSPVQSSGFRFGVIFSQVQETIVWFLCCWWPERCQPNRK
jgi:hypothetical protein